jgi:hypothetical protein
MGLLCVDVTILNLSKGCGAGNRVQYLPLYSMQPDYPQKVFNDKRSNFVLLMETLAMHS